MATAFKPFLKRLSSDLSGTALIEFAVGLPLFLTTATMGLEVANLALAHQSISNMSKMAADTAARGISAIDEADVNEIFLGSKMSASRFDFGSHGRIILSSLRPSPTGSGDWIQWQRCTGLLNVTSAYGGEDDGNVGKPPVNTTGIAVSAGTNIMLVEVLYDYQPLINMNIFGAKRIKYSAAFIVRERDNYAIVNIGNLPDNKKSLCSTFTA